MIFSLSWKLRMLTQTLPVHSLQAFTSHGGGKSSFRGRSGSGTANPKHWTGRLGGKFCRLCQAARFSRTIFTSHKVQDCSTVCLEKMSWFLTCKWILKSTQWLWSGSGSSMTNRPWNFLLLIWLHRLFATLVLNKDMPRIIMQDGKMHLINLL